MIRTILLCCAPSVIGFVTLLYYARIAPIGYKDETGYHDGRPHAR